jgi:MFS family permease
MKGEKIVSQKIHKIEKLWTPSFLILWQGQLVSTLGDAAYSIALGFWVLAVTGSTALMGTLMGVSTLPGVLVSPFAGVLLDRCNRKMLFILMDLIRGISIVFIAIAAYKDFIAVWMVFAAGIILSVCGAVFRPGVDSAIPDLVPKSKLTNANSVFAVVTNGASMLGNIAGGYLFQMLGAPFMFFLNGLSYLFSGGSIFLINIPSVKKKKEQHFINDMKDGFSFVWKLKGLRYIIIIAAFLNFFSFMAITLFLPLFQKTPGFGPGKYGIAMACFMGGAMVGYLFTSIVKIPPIRKFNIFIISIVLSNICFVIAVNQRVITIMTILLLFGGFFNSIVNVLLLSSVQLTTPQEMRGKVLAFNSMTTQGLTPFAMVLGGVLGDFIPIKIIMSACFIIVLIVITPFMFNKPLVRFINFDYEKETLDDII